MCTVSMITDRWNNDFERRYPNVFLPEISRAEFDALKHEVEELKQLLIQAKKFDELVGDGNCEMKDKIALFKKLGEYLGIETGFLDVPGGGGGG